MQEGSLQAPIRHIIGCEMMPSTMNQHSTKSYVGFLIFATDAAGALTYAIASPPFLI